MNGPDDVSKSTNIKWHESSITRQDKERLLDQKGVLLWFTGLSAAGKSTLANALENELFHCDCLTRVLDGDNVRHGLNNDLGFSPEDRMENIRRIGEVAKLFAESGVITMTAFISPYRSDRDRVRENMKNGDFVEVYLKCPMKELETRDPKGLYKKAHQGLIKDFTGISAPYEEPLDPELIIDTSELSVEHCVEIIMRYLNERGVICRTSRLASTGSVQADL
jgi:adenylylsulfate kinase